MATESTVGVYNTGSAPIRTLDIVEPDPVTQQPVTTKMQVVTVADGQGTLIRLASQDDVHELLDELRALRETMDLILETLRSS